MKSFFVTRFLDQKDIYTNQAKLFLMTNQVKHNPGTSNNRTDHKTRLRIFSELCLNLQFCPTFMHYVVSPVATSSEQSHTLH